MDGAAILLVYMQKSFMNIYNFEPKSELLCLIDYS